MTSYIFKNTKFLVQFIILRDIVTSNEHTAVLPDLSVNVYVTNVVPRTNLEFGTCVLMTVGVIPELSEAVGSVQETKAELAPAAAVTCLSSGHPIITGGSS